MNRTDGLGKTRQAADEPPSHSAYLLSMNREHDYTENIMKKLYSLIPVAVALLVFQAASFERKGSFDLTLSLSQDTPSFTKTPPEFAAGSDLPSFTKTPPELAADSELPSHTKLPPESLKVFGLLL